MSIGKFETDFLEIDNNDFSKIINDLQYIDNVESTQIEVNQGLEEALSELNQLKSQLSQDEGDTLIEQCKTTIIETITGQFGLASLFIDIKDGGNVTTPHNFEKGITSSDSDKQKYNDYKANNDGSKKWSDVRKDAGYDKPLPSLRKEAFKTKDIIIDDYTGRPLSKDGRAHIDHIVSAKEIENNIACNLHMSPEERAKMATSDSNLSWTAAGANQSKSDHSIKEWLDKTDKESGKTKGDKFGVDREKALNKDKHARKVIKKEINSAAFKKYSKELINTGAKDAAKMATYSAIGVVMREFVQGTFQAIKETFTERENKSFKLLFIEFKNKMKLVMAAIISKWKDILKGSLESGITSFFSNLLVFVINLFATTIKKFVTMIRAGFVSLVQAIKIIANPPKGMSIEEARYQAVKIMTAGLIGAASLGLSAAIEKFLQAIPGLQPIMMFPIPSFGSEPRTVSDIIAVTLSAMLGGLLTTTTIYLMDRVRRVGQQSKLQIQLVYQSGVVVDYKTAQSWFVLKDAYKYLSGKTSETINLFTEAKSNIDDSIEGSEKTHDGYSDALNNLRQSIKK